MRYLSVCSGIEAASQAWMPLGWEPVAFSEIEKFPCAVLAHHYPHIPNWGDMTKFLEWPDADIDVLCGGTPCQDYSIAGRRAGMAGSRGQLTLTFVEIAARYRPRWLVWENVPGVLSSNSGRDFARFLGDLTGQSVSVPNGGWKNAGVVSGTDGAYGVAWRVLDAQYVRTRRFPFAIPQRRRRVWLVGYIGDWRRAAAVLLDRQGMSGSAPPSRESGKRSSVDVAPCIVGSGCGTARAGEGRGQDPLISMATGQAGAEIAIGHGPTLTCNHEAPIVAHTLRGEGFDASEDGTGRQTLIPVAFPAEMSGTQCASSENISPALSVKHTIAAAMGFSCKNDGGDAIAGATPTMRAMGHSGSHANAGGQLAIAIQERAVCENLNAGPGGAGFRQDNASYTLEERHHVQAVAFAENSRAEVRLCGGDGQVMSQLTGGGGKPGQGQPTIVTQYSVRRLTPRECERLQGFTDDFTRIPFGARKKIEASELLYIRMTQPELSMEEARKLAADGPRYKALGNSWAVNCAEFIGERIAAVEAHDGR